MAHGQAIDPQAPDGCGRPAPFIIDAGISSPTHIARSWGLTAVRRERPANQAAGAPGAAGSDDDDGADPHPRHLHPDHRRRRPRHRRAGAAHHSETPRRRRLRQRPLPAAEAGISRRRIPRPGCRTVADHLPAAGRGPARPQGRGGSAKATGQRRARRAGHRYSRHHRRLAGGRRPAEGRPRQRASPGSAARTSPASISAPSSSKSFEAAGLLRPEA